MREEHRALTADNALEARLLDFLLQRPVVSIRMAEEHLGCSYVTAAGAIEHLQARGLVIEITGQRRNRLFRYDPYLALFDRHALNVAPIAEAPIQATQPEPRRD